MSTGQRKWVGPVKFLAVAIAASVVSRLIFGGEKGHWNDIGEAIVNFGIFAFLLIYFARAPFKKFLETRSQTISNQLDEAGRLHAEAEATLDEYRSKLEEFDQEKEKVLEGYRRRGEKERDAIIADAKDHAERLKKDAKTVLEYEIKRARKNIQERIVDHALEQAKAKIAESLDTKRKRELVAEYIDALQTHAKESRA